MGFTSYTILRREQLTANIGIWLTTTFVSHFSYGKFCSYRGIKRIRTSSRGTKRICSICCSKTLHFPPNLSSYKYLSFHIFLTTIWLKNKYIEAICASHHFYHITHHFDCHSARFLFYDVKESNLHTLSNIFLHTISVGRTCSFLPYVPCESSFVSYCKPIWKKNLPCFFYLMSWYLNLPRWTHFGSCVVPWEVGQCDGQADFKIICAYEADQEGYSELSVIAVTNMYIRFTVRRGARGWICSLTSLNLFYDRSK